LQINRTPASARAHTHRSKGSGHLFPVVNRQQLSVAHSAALALCWLRNRLGPVAFLACICSALPCVLNASNLRGVVRDQSGEAVGYAQVELRSQDLDMVTHSNASGEFLLQGNPPSGTLTIRAEGFATVVLRCCSSDLITVEVKPAAIGDTVIVTAERRPIPIATTAADAVSLPANEVNTPTALTLDDALRQAPGFTLFRRSNSLTANPTTQGASVRGLGASGASRVLVLQDGIPLNDPFGGWIYWDRIPRLALYRAEVLRGAGSSLYGSAALAGVVELFTRPQQNLASAEFSGGGLGEGDGEAFVSHQAGPWNLTGKAEGFRDSGAFVVAPEDRGAIDRKADLHFANGTIRIDRRLSADFRLFTSGSLFSEQRNNGTLLQVNSTHLGQFATGLDFNHEKTAISARFYGTGQKLHQSFSSISPDRSSETLVRWQTVPSAELGFLAQGSRTFSQFQVTAGAEGRFIHGETDETAFVRDLATTLSLAGGTDRNLGAFAELSASPFRRMRASLGVRLDEWSTDNSFSRTLAVTGAPPFISPVGNHSEWATSPRVGLVYQMPASFEAIASVYGGFRAPTLNELYRSFRLGNVVTAANAQLRAERLHGGEAGVRYVRTRYMLTAVFFRERVDDPVANVTQSVTPALIVRQRENAGALDATGADINGVLQLKRIQLRTGYEYVHSTVTSFSADPTLVGKLVPQTPAHVVTETLIYLAPHGFTLEAVARASSSQFDDDQNQLSLAPYSSFGISVAKHLRNAEVFGAVSNLFDSRIETAATPVISVSPGRILRGGVRFRFGAH
jgi:outer membrane receptor protein involved in Fe transport